MSANNGGGFPDGCTALVITATIIFILSLSVGILIGYIAHQQDLIDECKANPSCTIQ